MKPKTSTSKKEKIVKAKKEQKKPLYTGAENFSSLQKEQDPSKFSKRVKATNLDKGLIWN